MFSSFPVNKGNTRAASGKKLLTSLALLTCVYLAPANAGAEKGQAGVESNFSMGFGARALGMGQAFTALADDPTAMFWNAAGLEHVYQQSFSFFHTSLYEGGLYDFMGYTYPTLNLGTFGLGVGRAGIGDLMERGEQGEYLGKFSSEEYHAFFSYAKRLPWYLTAGFSVKVVRRAWSGLSEGVLADNGVGMDLGLLYKPEMFSHILLRDWSFGLNIQNLFKPQLNEGIESDGYPLALRFGILRKIFILGEGNYLNGLLDLDYSATRDLRMHVGAEYRLMGMGSLRLGYNGISATLGAGIQYSVFQIDYSFGQSPYSDVFSTQHRFSVGFNFGQTRDEMFQISEARRIAEEERIVTAMREADRQKLVAQRLKAGDEFFNSGNYLDAIVEYQQVVQQDAFNPRAQAMLDSSENMLQRELDTQRALAVREALDKDRAETDRLFVKEHFEKGRLFLDKNQFTESLIEFNLALERAPEDATMVSAVSTTQRRLQEEINRLVSQGRQQFQNGDYSEAMRLLTDARVLGGDNPAIQTEIETLIRRVKIQDNIQKGLSLFEIGEYDTAIQMFDEALKVNPDEELARQYLERSRLESQSREEKMDPETERRYLEGMDRFVKGKYQDAITIWQEILDKHPYNRKVLKAVKGARERLNKSR
jgi:tetratricopeptide (TPR) repeat protein